jgi:hypothetical protein
MTTDESCHNPVFFKEAEFVVVSGFDWDLGFALPRVSSLSFLFPSSASPGYEIMALRCVVSIRQSDL